jgi:hypothetical protein
MFDTPEVDCFAEEEAAGLKDITELYPLARKIEQEKNEARSALEYLSFYLGQGLGDEQTTINQYTQRIIEGINYINDITKKDQCR